MEKIFGKDNGNFDKPMELQNVASNLTSGANNSITEVQNQNKNSSYEENFSHKQTSVLLIEDHRISSKVAKTILSGLDCKVDVAMDGKSAIELSENQHYDLIFIDIGLPDMSGYSLSRRIRMHEQTTGTHIPIIGLTVYSDNENQKKSLEAGMNETVVKPLQKKQAEEILNTFVPSRKKWLEDNHFEGEALQDTAKPYEKIVDFSYAKVLLNDDEKEVSEMLTLLLDSLPHEVEKLQAAYQEGYWIGLQSIVHKLNGGASYCGTLRLKSACDKLDNYIKSGSTLLTDELYRNLLFEIEALQKFMGR